MTPSQKKQLTSPSFWATIITALGAIGSGLMDVGNPVTISIGAVVTAIYTIAQKFENVSIAGQQVQATTGNTTLDKVSALVPIVEQQVGNVATLIKTVNDHMQIINYRLKGYEVTPHVDSPTQTTTFAPPPQAPPAKVLPLNAPEVPGGGHEVIGRGT